MTALFICFQKPRIMWSISCHLSWVHTAVSFQLGSHLKILQQQVFNGISVSIVFSDYKNCSSIVVAPGICQPLLGIEMVTKKINIESVNNMKEMEQDVLSH